MCFFYFNWFYIYHAEITYCSAYIKERQYSINLYKYNLNQHNIKNIKI